MATFAEGRKVFTVTDNSDTPHSSSGSGRIPQAVFTFLEDVPEAGRIKSVGLMVASTDPKIVGRWPGERADFCRDLPGNMFGLPNMPLVRIFRPQPTSGPSRVQINGLEWLQIEVPKIPTAPEHIVSLVIRTAKSALFFIPAIEPTPPHLNGRGSWHSLRISDIQTKRQLWLHVLDEILKYEIEIKFLPESDGSTTALVATRKVP